MKQSMWQRQLQAAYHHGKRTIGNMFHSAVKFAGQLDHGISVGKRLFGALDPMLQDMGAGSVSRAAVRGFGRYEQGREQVLGQHNQVQAHLSRLRKSVPELGLD